MQPSLFREEAPRNLPAPGECPQPSPVFSPISHSKSPHVMFISCSQHPRRYLQDSFPDPVFLTFPFLRLRYRSGPTQLLEFVLVPEPTAWVTTSLHQCGSIPCTVEHEEVGRERGRPQSRTLATQGIPMESPQRWRGNILPPATRMGIGHLGRGWETSVAENDCMWLGECGGARWGIGLSPRVDFGFP